MSLNQFTGYGNLTKDPEKHVTKAGTVVNFILAINRPTKDRKADYLRITVWGPAGDACAKYLKKGDPCIVTGEVRQDTWETADGEKKSSVGIMAHKVEFTKDRRNDGNRKQYRPPDTAPTQPQAEQEAPPPGPVPPEEIDIDEDPF